MARREVAHEGVEFLAAVGRGCGAEHRAGGNCVHEGPSPHDRLWYDIEANGVVVREGDVSPFAEFMKDGDLMETEIQGIGVMRNPIGSY